MLSPALAVGVGAEAPLRPGTLTSSLYASPSAGPAALPGQQAGLNTPSGRSSGRLDRGEGGLAIPSWQLLQCQLGNRGRPSGGVYLRVNEQVRKKQEGISRPPPEQSIGPPRLVQEQQAPVGSGDSYHREWVEG